MIILYPNHVVYIYIYVVTSNDDKQDTDQNYKFSYIVYIVSPSGQHCMHES